MKLSIDLPTLGQQPTRAIAKPERGTDRITRRRTREAQATAFRGHVWKRELAKHEDGARCQSCGRGPLLRTLDVLNPMAGHVAHDRGRRCAPADRYAPDKAKLLCRSCHLATHSMRFA